MIFFTNNLERHLWLTETNPSIHTFQNNDYEQAKQCFFCFGIYDHNKKKQWIGIQ